MKVRIKFRKQGAMKFIGHLDTMRYFQKVMRRARVDIAYSGGFSPHQIMSFAAPLGVGVLSNGEYLDIEVHSSEDSGTMVRRLNAVMSEGMEVLSFRRLADPAKSAMSLVAAADYILTFRPGKEPADRETYFGALRRFYDQKEIPVTKKTKRGEKVMDLRPLVYRMERVLAVPMDAGAVLSGAPAPAAVPVMRCGAVEEPADAVFLRVCTGSTDNIKPELVMETFCAFMGSALAPFTFQAEREEVYADLGGGEERKFVPLEALGEDIEQTDHHEAPRTDPDGADGGYEGRSAGICG